MRSLLLGLGALDDFELNLDLASDTEAPDYLNQVAILDVLPISEQWNYMQGVKWDRYMDDGKWMFVLSRNMLNNSAFKHVDNDVDLPRTLDYVSQEIENKFRAERFRSLAGGWKLSGGVSAEYAKYNNSTRNTVFVPEVGSVDVTFGSDFKMAKYGAFAQASRPLLENRLTLSAGMRVDGALLLGASEGLALPEGEPLANPLDQFSPRVSASWSFAPVDLECQRWHLPPIAGLHHLGIRWIGCGQQFDLVELDGWADVHHQPPACDGHPQRDCLSECRRVGGRVLQRIHRVARQREHGHRFGQFGC